MVTQARIYHFHLNFLHTFTALGNSNPWVISWISTYLEVIFVSLLVISIQFYPLSRKNIIKCSAVWNIDFVSNQQFQFFVFTFPWPLFKFTVNPSILIKVRCLIPFPKYLYICCCPWSELCTFFLHSFPIPFTYFLIFGYLLWTPDKSNSWYM